LEGKSESEELAKIHVLLLKEKEGTVKVTQGY